MLVGCTGFGIFLVYIFSLFSASALTLGSPAGVGADLTWLYKSFHSRPCRSCRRSRKVPTLLLCHRRIPANVLIVCNDRKLRPFDPTHALADLPVEIWRLDSKPMSYAPTDVLANVPHSKTSPIAAHIRFLTTSLSQMQTRNLEAKYSNGKEYRAIPTTNLYLKVCLVFCSPFSHAVAIVMLVLANN